MRERVNGSSDSGLPPDVHATVVTVGTFDGVHRGHRDVLDRLVARGKSLGRRTVLVTFEPHPLEVVNPAAAPLMAFGIFVATFSSIYVASPLLLWIEHRWPRTATDGASKAAVRASRTEIPATQRATRDRQPKSAASR